MLMPAAGTTGVAAQSWETALALRGMALLQPDLPKYLLAPEVAVLLSQFADERQRMLFAFLWNTGARITEALMVTPEDLQLDGPRPFVRLRTLKQRSRGRGRPAKDEKVARVVPLLDGAFVRELHRYLATFRPGRRTPLFAVTRKTAWSWLQQAIDRAGTSGIAFAVTPVSPRTLRHSFAMHLFLNHVPPKVVQTYMGHERYESTEQYLKVFALDVAPQLGIRFSLDAQDFAGMLTRK
ncbi:tyrosine-type recombinase/integrase [Erwinia persicina]|uniref:Resolvase n=1 Tax=Erwinia persicina TaxID=55211 RepID=A0A4U3ETA3_9GAMM|nr:tyrosine-type recombinase/integrase [Erwinia persicina]MBD8170206.1 tyrosine-type recombinase/integrase [Erwinia persicina]TKJ82859.1 resolvase [Erwinia persicina]